MLINRPTPEQMAPIEALRVRIADLHNQVRELMAAPPDSAEIARRVKATAQHADIGGAARRHLRTTLLSGEFSAPDAASLLGGLTGLQLAALVLGDQLERSLATLAQDAGDGISNEERAGRLSALRSELDQLETDEEHALEELEAAGLVVRRRPDARPSIVLGLQ